MNKTSLGTLLLLAGVVILAAVAVLAFLDVGTWLLISVSAGVAGIALYLVHFWLNRDLRHLWKRAEELKPQERKLRFGELRTSELHDLAQKLNQALASFDHDRASGSSPHGIAIASGHTGRPALVAG